MPRFSVVVPAYNIEQYIERCIRSLKAQTLKDFEAIVVDDCSVDGTSALIERGINGDDRFTLIRHSKNSKAHIARKTGAEKAAGDYIVFLDGDDELAPSFLEDLSGRLDATDADMLHFGITVISEGVPEEECKAFADFNNHPSGLLNSMELQEAVFVEGDGQTMDWRVTQRVYRAGFLKEAFSKMTDEPLDRAEDGYEFYAIAALANSSMGAEDIRGYIYHYGCGITGSSIISAERFGEFSRSFNECLNAAREFAVVNPGRVINGCFEGFKHKMIELLANDWDVRVRQEEKSKATEYFIEALGAPVAAREIWRFVRDHAYVFIDSKALPSEDDCLWKYAEYAKSISVSDAATDDDGMRFRDMRQTAKYYVDELSRKLRFEKYAEQDIRIFVSAHKRVNVPNSLILQPVQVGHGNKSDRFLGFLHDDEGANISGLNPMYCELTTQYWAWKNVKAEYVGFCHYRRYFNFSDVEYDENPYGEVIAGEIDDAACERYGLSDDKIKECVTGYDVITTGIHDLRDFPGDISTPREQYAAAERLHYKDLEAVIDILKEKYPDYAVDADAFLDGNFSCFCNMYIMRYEIFSRYCEWLFPILEEFCARESMEFYSREALRTPGHLAERLFNIYYMHAMRVDEGWRTKQLQCVHFEKPEEAAVLVPLADWSPELVKGKKLVPVVFASDNSYVPMLTTTITSMVENASKDYLYDIVVLQRDIAYEYKQEMEAYLRRFENVSIRFCDVSGYIQGFRLETNNAHISIETYYRFLVQEIFRGYDKVLYLDSDLIVNGDISELYNVELGDNLLAAVKDVDYLGNLNMPDGERVEYSIEKLALSDPYSYFQAGVLLLNVRELRKLHTISEWLTIVSNSDYIYDDQDILNKECQGRVVYLDFDWNVMHDCIGRVAKVFSWAPEDIFAGYLESRACPKIIHYAGFEKPWVNPRCDFSNQYWLYARDTPFYETLVWLLSKNVSNAVADEHARRALGDAEEHLRAVLDERFPRHEKAVSEENPIRTVVDPIAPYGTRRREVLKAVARFVRGKK